MISPLFLIALVAIIAFLPAINGGAVWDDATLFQPGFSTGWNGLGRIWFHPSSLAGEEHYWPITYTAFWLQRAMWLDLMVGYHLVNVALHVVCCLLLYRAAREIAPQAALPGALLFAVHPVHVESVAWIIELKDVLSGVFYVAAMLAYLRLRRDSGRLWPGLLFVVGLFIAAVWSKSVAVTFPAGVLLVDYYMSGRIHRRAWITAGITAAIGLALMAFDLSLVNAREVRALDLSWGDRIAIAGHNLWFYPAKLAWPHPLVFFYPKWALGANAPLAGGALIALAGLTLVALWLMRGRIGRGPVVALLFYWVTLSPTLGLIPFSFLQFAHAADRYQYLASVGLLLGVGGAMVAISRRLSQKGILAAKVAFAALLLALMTLTWQHSARFHDTNTLFRHVLLHNPESVTALQLTAIASVKSGDLEEAVELLTRATGLAPEDSQFRYNLAQIERMRGNRGQALRHVQEAIRLKPDYATALRLRDQLTSAP
ncbi:hypothetical protein CVU37_14255 [candidate division BRC1 bacterium HGW-BRC1-1]|nr:MAG: hypothetical protein CVU37_14255 [candidate division BRC1 bacterium HGW-BRC1-1]